MISDTTVIGIDPDLHTTSIGVLSYPALKPIDFHVFRVDRQHTDVQAVIELASSYMVGRFELGVMAAIVIEMPDIWRGASQAMPRDILNLATVSGAMLAMVCAGPGFHNQTKIYMPRASEWKGQVPKEIHQARVWRRLEIQCSPAKGYQIPIIPGMKQPKNKGDWKHIGDAFGLAAWGALQLDKDSMTKKLLKNSSSDSSL